jgi:signal transduction histidine kinase
VDDDGSGFNFSGSFTLDELDLLRLGPQSIKRRVRSLGGDLTIESRPGHGASLKFRFPA